MAPKPQFLRSKDIEKYYAVDNRQAEEVTKKLTPCGVYGKDNLYSRQDVEKEIK